MQPPVHAAMRYETLYRFLTQGTVWRDDDGVHPAHSQSMQFFIRGKPETLADLRFFFVKDDTQYQQSPTGN